MEVAPPPQQQLLGDSFSRGWLTKRGARAPSLERLVANADLGHSFGSSRSFSFIDMDHGELFSMQWTGTGMGTATASPESDFDFGLIPGVGGCGSDPPSPVLVSASRVIRDGRLLPGDPDGLQERAADPPSAPRSPLFRSAHSTPASPSPSSCSSGRTSGRRGASSWKILLQYLRFLVPLYRKVRALRRFPAPRRRPHVAPASPAGVEVE